MASLPASATASETAERPAWLNERIRERLARAPSCALQVCASCGHVRCGAQWDQDETSPGGGAWSVCCRTNEHCRNDACLVCKMAYSEKYATNSFPVCCHCLDNHPDPERSGASSRQHRGYSGDLETWVAKEIVQEEFDRREEQRRGDNQCQSPIGCSNWGSKTAADGKLLCNACYSNMSAR